MKFTLFQVLPINGEMDLIGAFLKWANCQFDYAKNFDDLKSMGLAAPNKPTTVATAYNGQWVAYSAMDLIRWFEKNGLTPC